jgi:hypothetical protein
VIPRLPSRHPPSSAMPRASSVGEWAVNLQGYGAARRKSPPKPGVRISWMGCSGEVSAT